MLKTVWNLKEQNNLLANDLASKLDISPITAQLLINRDHQDPDKIRSFINPSMQDLRDPFVFNPMDRAVERIRTSLQNDQNILIYGDYDVDGISATATLVNYFQLINREVDYYVPDRLEEGFGLNMDTVRMLLDSYDPDLLITIDCGTSNKEEIAFAREQGVDTIVVDHHEPPPELPPAEAIINPKVEQAGYPFRGLCASGVTFKLVWGLSQKFSDQKKVSPEFKEFLVDSMGMVALGTVADQVPLVDENRVFARFGMSSLPETDNPGVQAMLEQTDLEDEEIETSHIGYKIAPPLNAAGRLQKSDLGLSLFLSDSVEQAREIAEELDAVNRKRRRKQRQIEKGAKEKIRNELNPETEPVIVTSHPDWHPGIVGVAASRIVETYSRPAILIGTGVEPAKGSARSVEGFPLHTALEECSDLLIKHGGHARAAGLTLDKQNIEALRNRLNELVDGSGGSFGDTQPRRTIDVDLEIFLPNLNWSLLHEIKKLEPHGMGNPEPVFGSSGLEVCSPPELMGNNGNHLSFRVAQGGSERRVVGFGMGDKISLLDEIPPEQLALAYRPVINSWRGRKSIELHLVDIQDRSRIQLSTEKTG